MIRIAWLCAFLAAPAAAGPSSCVTCHEGAASVPYLEHNFTDWAKSRHAIAGVSCAACHGGAESETDKSAAHKGVRPSSDPKSPVYFTSVPGTCGACHAREASAFKASRHWSELKGTGRGPNCVTCHGSMANHVLAPRELELTCTLCHRRPTRAYATLMSLGHAARSLEKLKAAVERSKGQGLDPAAQERALAAAGELQAGAVVDWHTFDMPGVLKTSREVSRQTLNALHELKLKGLQQDHGREKTP